MIDVAETINGRTFVVSRAKINHPHADEVSIAMGDNGSCSFPYTVELAFFKDGVWCAYVMDELADYSDSTGYVVYTGVPMLDFAKFLDYYTRENS